jgi:hypothetical protein
VRDREELIAALADARDLPDGDHKVAELERVAAHADAAGDLRLGLDARFGLIEAFDLHPERWRILHPVGWCLAALDRDPTAFTDRDAELLRRFHSSAVAAACGTPRVGLTRTRAALDDLERRLRDGGHGAQVVHNLRCRLADHVGDEAGARAWLARWRATERDRNSECPGCEPSRQAELLARWGDWAEALGVLDPALHGAPDCTEQPERALANAMLPYLRLGRHEQAALAHVLSYRRHRDERAAFPYLAGHLRYCALTGRHQRGLSILAAQLGGLDGPYDDASAMEFAAAGALVCRLAAEAGFAGRMLHRPGYARRRAAELTVAALGSELLATAQDLAGQFDARNGTSHQSGRMAAWLADRPVAGEVDLPPDGPVDSALDTLDGGAPRGGPEDRAPHDGAGGMPVGRRSGAANCPPDVVVPLSLAAILAVLAERDDDYLVDSDGTVGGRWGRALIEFEQLGERGEILHARVVAERRLPADRLAEAYEFCNSWNHDRLLPKAYVRHGTDGELVLTGDVSTDLEYGVTADQLAVIINMTIATGAAFATAAATLP